jgi:hypothetical protein
MKSEKHIKTKINGRIIEWWGWETTFEKHPTMSMSKGFSSAAFSSDRVFPVFHRIDGPAYISYDSEDGPKVEYNYLLGFHVSKEDFETPGFIDSFIMNHS